MQPRFLAVLIVVLTVALGALPASASAKVEPVHFRTTTLSAFAFWDTCGATIVWDVPCTGTLALVSVDDTDPDKAYPHVDSSSLFFIQVTYMYVRTGENTGFALTLSTRSGGAETPVTIKRSLKHASGSATVAIDECIYRLDPDNVNRSECHDAGTVEVNLSWQGIGAVSRSNDTIHEHWHGFTMNIHSALSERDAVATGTVDEVDGGMLVSASIVHERYGEVSICHGDC